MYKNTFIIKIRAILISYVLGDHLWPTTMLLRPPWRKIPFWQHRRSQKDIRKIGLVWKYSKWVSHELSQKNLDDRVVMCTYLLAQNKIARAFLEPIITGDEKWITYENIVKKHLLPLEVHPKCCSPGLRILRLSLVLIKVFEGQKIQKWRKYQTCCGSVFRIKRWNIFQKWDIQIVLTLARSH